MSKLKFSFLICFSILGLNSFAQITTTVPTSEAVKTGVLENGMTYYIMHNEEPKDRASFYFVQNVGGILENDSQNGLAHFLEHMAFNGLENFPGKNMLDYLEKNGILFGRDINAYTAQDETVYNLSNIPVAREALLDSALLVLHDWSGGLLLEGNEIESERGVIHEEWRTRRDANFRLRSKTNHVMFNNSKYADRDVIGSLDVIDNFKHSVLRDYYEKWYRPDLQAVVVVGDIDAEKMEAKVKALFSKIPMPKNAAKRKYTKVEDSKEVGYVAAKDKEARSLSIMWGFRNDLDKVITEETQRRDMATSMFNSMLKSRLAEKTKKLECSAAAMEIAGFEMVRTKGLDYIYVSPKIGKELEAFAEVLTELERVKRYGFTKSELDRVKVQFQRSYESYYVNYSKIDNDTHAKALGNLFLKSKPFPSIDWEMTFAAKTIPAITLEEVNALVAKYSDENNSALILKGPDNATQYYPTKEELLAVAAKVKSSKIEAYTEEGNDKPLVAKKLNAAIITSTFKVEGTDAKGYVLENGAKVVVLPTELSKDKISMSSFSFGGTSLLDVKDLASADMATGIVEMSGVGEFNATNLKRKLAGKIVSLGANLGGLTEGFSGSASPQDFETLMQLLYLNFEAPRFDKAPFDAQMAQINNYLANIGVDNNKALKDTIALASSNYNSRTLLFGEEFVKNIDFNRASEIYKERFSDASDFTFIFVGNINEAVHLPMILKYIGNITSTNRKESFVDHKVGPAKGKTIKTFNRKMAVPKTTVSYALSGEFDYTLKNRLMLNVVSQLLSKRYMTTIREEEGGSYGVGVSPSASKLPSSEFSININFDTDPAKCDRLMEIVKEELVKIQKEACNADDLNEIKNNFIKSREESELKNGFWMGVIQNNLMLGSKYTSKEDYKKIVEGIDAASVKKFAKKLLKKTNIVEVIMNPAE
ncbi:pitrilysin family protein [Ancylomarina sp. 16SWW S1-10-2]|uniref:M16 family metallopeptidase n=1 Tax=Ancylomarina sp. 16SWW S1-10-2 TaxID=2499681 RepID=UPI001E3BA7F1|nr:insulinase family protein [Ancylomarina sp. 16SWW S1-10-2]